MSLPIISVQQMREWERATWAAGQTESAVIARVGRAVSHHALRMTAAAETILILAGKGHNGDDARSALPHLIDRNVILIEAREPHLALKEFQSRQLPKPKLILDGLFGIGLSRPLDDAWQKLIIAVNETNIPVLAIDAPSGLDADTGEIRGAAIRAALTLTIGAVKRGMVRASAIEFVGRLEIARDVGLIDCPFKNELNWTSAEDFADFPPKRAASAHKGTYGHVAIVAGSLGYHGAAVLSANGALRAQPGLVSLWTQENIFVPVASQLQAAMVHPWKSGRTFPNSCSAILFGPGLAATDLPELLKKELLKLWAQSELPVVADASALDWLPPVANFDGMLRVITPHPGEAARMLSISSADVQADRVAALRKLSARFGNCLVVLKGHRTLVGRSDGEIFVNSSGNPFLAQGGSGDVLAGYIAGLLAQPPLQKNALKTIRYAVWQHGAAADRLCDEKRNWTIDDLLHVLGGNF